MKALNQGKSSPIREKSGKYQGIWFVKFCGHPVFAYAKKRFSHDMAHMNFVRSTRLLGFSCGETQTSLSTEELIKCVFDDNFANFFIKTYVVGTH